MRASLGIPETGEIATEQEDVGETVAPAAEPEVEEPEEDRPLRLRMSRSLRKSEQVPVVPRAAAVSSSGKLPARRHSERELRQLQRAEPPPVIDPGQHLLRMELRWWGVLAVYLLAMAGPGFATAGILSSRALPMDLPRWWADVVFAENARTIWMMTGGGGIGLMLLLAGWLVKFKKRASHHAAILVIVAVLVLTAGILYFFPELHGT